VGARLNAAWQARGTSVSSSPMFLLPCSRWVPGATPPGESRLRRRRSSRRHGTRVSPRHSSERRRQVVRTIEACSCSCCSAPSDRDKSDDPSPALRMHAVALRDAVSSTHRTSAGAPPSWLKVKVRRARRFFIGGIVDNQGDFGGCCSSPNDVVGGLDARGDNRRRSARPFARCTNVRGPAGSLHINRHDAWWCCRPRPGP